MIQANAGMPVMKEGKVHYPESPAEMVSHVGELIGCGVRILGGCCGTTEEHVKALRNAIDQQKETA